MVRLLVCSLLCALVLGQSVVGLSASAVAIEPEKNPKERLQQDFKRLEVFSNQLQEMRKDVAFLQMTVGLNQRGYYTSDEHDKIEELFFRFLMCRQSLWDIAIYYRDYVELFPDLTDKTKAFLLGFSAAVQLYYYSTVLVASFVEEEVVINKMDEAYYRSGIKAGTFSEIVRNTTSIDNIEGLKTAWQIVCAESFQKESCLARLIQTDPVYRELLRGIGAMYVDADIRVRFILDRQALLFPETENRLRHTSIAKLARKAEGEWDDNLDAARAVLFENVSRMKDPFSNLVWFSSAQAKDVRAVLQPGDIILTFTDGYMSNIFLPGAFKHGLTYVGTPEQRRAAGLVGENLSDVAPSKKMKLLLDIGQERLPSGGQADVIEAVSEGVIFNSLDKILAMHINRLLIIRPKVSREERVEQLKSTFLLLGNGYDFYFDFNSATTHCCTEVLYRGLYGRGGIEFSLTPRAGVQTLSADDLINYYLHAGSSRFSFLFYAEEDPARDDHRARILTGAKGLERLKRVMKEEGDLTSAPKKKEPSFFSGLWN